MQDRRGDFYIYRQHDDLVSPTCISGLVNALARWILADRWRVALSRVL
jgi:hypothetical protein